MVMPRQKTPGLVLNTLSHGSFDLDNEAATRGTLVTFYRGLHCPICATYLAELERLTPDFAARGVGTVAVSSDGAGRAADMGAKIKASALRIAYDLPLSQARDWGLFISSGRGKTSIGIEEPALFSEPGVFLINPDRTLYFATVQTMPFVRPHFSEMLKAIDFAVEKSYPARGEYAGAV